MKVWNQ